MGSASGKADWTLASLKILSESTDNLTNFLKRFCPKFGQSTQTESQKMFE